MDMIRTSALTLFVASVVALAAGCATDAGSDSQGNAENPTVDDPTVDDARDTTQPDLVLEDDTSVNSRYTPSQVEVHHGEQPSEISAAHILIMHQGSDRVPAGLTRTKEEALALAQEIANKAQEDDADFAALARQYSDGPTGPAGGNLGVFPPDQMVKPFSDATLKLAIGEVSGPVETQFGYHIILRQAIEKASAKHILVMHTGSLRVSPEITRTKEEAVSRIQECLARCRQGESFEDLAKEYSDGPTAPNGGDLGEFFRGDMVPEFDQATFACDVGQITDVVETPFGYHIIYRYR